MVSTSCLVEMSKQQTGLRIDRVLFKQFQQLCALEKLRPGEGIEEPGSEGFVKELVELGKRSVSEELVKEFETALAEADKLYDETEKDTIEDEIAREKR